MKQKTKYIIIFIIIVLLAIITLWVLNYNYSIFSSVTHKLTYYDDYEPGSRYDINVFNNKVEIIRNKSCNTVNCDEQNSEKEVFYYSTENINRLNNFIKNSLYNKSVVYANELTERQKEVVTGLLLGEYFFEAAVEDYKYKLVYTESDSTTYYFYFKDNYTVLAKKATISTDYDIKKIDTYSINFKEENINFLYNYIEELAKKENDNIVRKYSTLYKNEKNIYTSLTKNDESYLANIENDVKLLYTITYNGINCPTPSLLLYSDNTYEYYYTFSVGNTALIPKTGTYNYDINKIIENIDKYEENLAGPYTIKDNNGKSYTTYNTNTELIQFLDSINVKLEMCTEQQ